MGFFSRFCHLFRVPFRPLVVPLRPAPGEVATALRRRSAASGCVVRTTALRKEFQTPGGKKARAAAAPAWRIFRQLAALFLSLPLKVENRKGCCVLPHLCFLFLLLSWWFGQPDIAIMGVVGEG